jgi:hypothetical protein
MSALFELPTSYARISDDGLYRYTLGRRWTQDRSVGAATFIMLNPSTADAERDDNTIVRCCNFARDLGCGGLHVVNLYAYRATKPADLWRAPDPIGPDNDDFLRATFGVAREDDTPVIAAWGANAKPLRVEFVGVLARAAGVTLTALGVTKDGAPRHPLYLPASARPERWTA